MSVMMRFIILCWCAAVVSLIGTALYGGLVMSGGGMPPFAIFWLPASFLGLAALCGVGKIAWHVIRGDDI